ncbi:uncharacterized protein LOC144113360 [Amblyomma americanum]
MRTTGYPGYPAHSASVATTPCALQALCGASTWCAQTSVYSLRGRQRPLKAQHKSAGDLRQHQGPRPAAATRRGPCGSCGEGVVPCWFITADAKVSRRWLNRRHQLLNRKLTATVKRMPSVFILNPDVSTDMLVLSYTFGVNRTQKGK